MKNILSSKIIYTIILIIFTIQISLIAHRSSFSSNLIFKFYKKDEGIKEGIKNKKILDVLELIKKNKLEDYLLSEELKKIEKVMHRVYEGAYPVRHSLTSVNTITELKIKNNCTYTDNLNKIYLFKCE